MKWYNDTDIVAGIAVITALCFEFLFFLGFLLWKIWYK